MTAPRPQDTDPLDVTEPWLHPRLGVTGVGADPPAPQKRRGCSVFGWLALAVVVLAATMSTATLPVTSEVLRVPVTAGSGSSEASLVPGAPRVPCCRYEGSLPAVASAASERSEAWRPALVSMPATPPAYSAADVSYSGIINYAAPRHGRFYLAIPDGKGVRVEICGPAGCLIRTSTDAGPALFMQRAGRIADLNSVDWQEISGVPLRFGGFQGTILILKRPPRIVLPATDVGEGE